MTSVHAGSPPAAPPADPPTSRPGLWRRAPGWVFHAAAAIGAVGLLWSESYPYGGAVTLIVSAWWILICAGIWLARLIAYLNGRLTRPARPSGPAWPFAIAPATGVLVVALAMTGLPLQTRWGLSEGAFDARADQLVARVEQGEARPGSNLIRDDRVALYTVQFAHVDGDGNVFFSIAGSGFIDSGGFARLPDGPPKAKDELDREEFEHLGGDWYLWLAPF